MVLDLMVSEPSSSLVSSDSSTVLWIGLACIISVVGLQFVFMRFSEQEQHRLELPRKLQHLSSILAIVGMFYLFSTRLQRAMALGGGLLVVVFVHRLRLYFPKFNEYLIARFSSILRRQEHNSLPGAFFVLLGSFLTVLLYPLPVATLGTLYLGFGDPMASLVGVSYGKEYRFASGKSLPGFAAMAVTCAVVTGLFLAWFATLPLQVTLLWCLVGGVSAAAVESSALPIDDNFSIPVLSGAVLFAFQSFGLPLASES